MKIFNKVKEIFSRERYHQPSGSVRVQISKKLRSWGHSIKRTHAEGTKSYTKSLAQTSANIKENSLLNVGIETTSILDLSDIIQQYLPENDCSAPGSSSVSTPVLVLEPFQSFYLSISPYSNPPAMSKILVPPAPSSATPPQSIHSAVSNTSSNTSTHKAVSSVQSNKSLSTNTDYSDGLPATATHTSRGEHSGAQKQGLTTITPDITGDSHSSVPCLDGFAGDVNSDTGSPLTTSHQAVREKVDVQAGSRVQDMAEQENDVVHSSSNEATIQATDSSQNSDEKEEVRDRHDWDTIHKIPDLHFKQLFLSEISELNFATATIDDCTINARFDGGFNHIVFMMLTISGSEHCFVIRVPAIGTIARWQEGDAHNMRCEMALLAHLRKTTKIPVPEVIAFSDTLDTVIGAPFCLMTQLKGKPSHHVWFSDPANRNHVTANAITAELESKRCNTLRSLATIMAELQTLTFDKIGTPDLVNPSLTEESHSATHSYRWKAPSKMEAGDLESEGQVYKYGPFETSEEYMTSKLEESWPSIPDPDLGLDQDTYNMVSGVRMILDLLYVQPAIAFSSLDPDDIFEPESFVLRHPDLDFQNILVDDDGYVTGIIDWEGCMAVPRCVGYASFPDFLCRDWSEGHSLRDSPHMTWKLRHYRQVYADAMKATGAPDAKYTLKSPMYRAVVDAINEGSPMDLIEKLFVHIPDLRTTNVQEFEQFIGEGWPEALNYLGEELLKLFQPEA